jgi:hypothetical protein
MLSCGRIPGHHLARVHAGAAGQPNAPEVLELVVQALERRAHSVRRGDSANRVVLAYDREPEDRHHRVPDVLLDKAAVTLQHTSHLFEIAGHHRAQRLRVERLAHARRSGEVAEDDRDELPRRLRGLVRDELRPAIPAQTEFLGVLLPAVGTDPHAAECTFRPADVDVRTAHPGGEQALRSAHQLPPSLGQRLEARVLNKPFDRGRYCPGNPGLGGGFLA